MKKGWHQENQLLPCLNQISFCIFQGWKNCKILAQFFQGNDFRDCYLIEYLAGIYFREFDQNPQKLVPLRYIFQFFCEMDYQ